MCGVGMRKPHLFLEVVLTFPLFLGMLTFRYRFQVWYVGLVKLSLRATLKIWNKAVESVGKYICCLVGCPDVRRAESSENI